MVASVVVVVVVVVDWEISSKKEGKKAAKIQKLFERSRKKTCARPVLTGEIALKQDKARFFDR